MNANETYKPMTNIALTGAGGQLGLFFRETLEKHRFNFRAFARDWDITSENKSLECIQNANFDVLINCAAFTDVEEAESRKQICFDVNADALDRLSKLCRRHGILLVHFSTDYVFDGKSRQPYLETAPAHPINVYGESKLRGEEMIRASGCPHLIFRLSWLFGGHHGGFPEKLEQWRQRSKILQITDDETSSPTYAGHIPPLVIRAIEKKLRGTYHLNSSGGCSRFEWASFYAKKAGWTEYDMQPASMRSFQTKARRPHFSTMNNQRFQAESATTLPSWKEATIDYLHQKRPGQLGEC
jgi:dTDP-4-dehydrorhamnose reductase